jgi:hypothetical protein
MVIQYDSMNVIPRQTHANTPFLIRKSTHYVTFSHWIGRDHAIELDLDHLEGEHLFTWTLLMMEQV